MKILLTGASGYIGKRLLPLLLKEGHQVVILARDPSRIFLPSSFKEHVTLIKGDLLSLESLSHIPTGIQAAYYLVHSMHQTKGNFAELESLCAQNFVEMIAQTSCKQIIYLSGLSQGEHLSTHLNSRKNVESLLKSAPCAVTVLRSSIIIGSGSASFEIMRDLVEKLPIMIAPKWVMRKAQPISIFDALDYLLAILGNKKCYGQTFEIGGPEVLSYMDMLLRFAKLRKLWRLIIPIPVLTPELSSYWLIFITSTNYNLARSLIESLRNDSYCKDFSVQSILPKKCLSFEEAVSRAFEKTEENALLSSWRDSLVLSNLNPDLNLYVQVPTFGCLRNIQTVAVPSDKIDSVLSNIWSIGGNRGWYYWNWAWSIRGFIDRCLGGVGLRRGRTHPFHIQNGDALDFWRVILADKENRRLLLYAEMVLPGEAWLEFSITATTQEYVLNQVATFRPRGLLGRLYWWVLYPFHLFIFKGMAKGVVNTSPLPLKK